MLCAIEQNDILAASDILQSLDDATLKEPMTAYLAFKVALKQEDVDGASRCLEQISEASSSDPQYLYACCLEAQQAQDRISTIKALQHIVHNHRLSSDSIHLPALLRVLIRLEVSVLNDEQEDNVAKKGLLVEDLCNVFKTGKYAFVVSRLKA